MSKPIKVIYRDSSILAAHKPAGIATYSESRKEGNEGCKELLEEQLTQRLFPIHRIDADTEGLVLFALDSKAAAAMIQLFKRQQVKKTYLAWCVGEVAPNGSITFPLKKNKSPEKESARTDFERVKVTTYQGQKFSNVKVSPQTGRYHQIRRHFDTLGFPLVGDPQYGNPDAWLPFFKPQEKHTLMLFAESVEFIHPHTKKKMTIKAKAHR